MPYIIPRIDPRPLRPDDIKDYTHVLALSINGSVRDFMARHQGQMPTPAHLMSFTQRAWRLTADRADAAQLIFACCKTDEGVPQIIGVFHFDPSGAKGDGHPGFVSRPDNPQRRFFLAFPASEEVWNRYVGLFLPKPKPGEINPVHYYEQQ